MSASDDKRHKFGMSVSRPNVIYRGESSPNWHDRPQLLSLYKFLCVFIGSYKFGCSSRVSLSCEQPLAPNRTKVVPQLP